MSSPPAFTGNLRRRVATALVALPALLALLFLAPPVAFVSLVAAVLIQGMREMLGLLRAAGVRPALLAGWLALAAFFVDTAAPLRVGVPLWPAGLLALACWAILQKRGEGVNGAAATWLAAAYLGGLGGMLAALRLLPPLEQGTWRIVLLLASVMAADTAAYFAGHALGRHPLAPGVSPGKTVEGALGGLLGGALGALAARALGLPALPASHALVLGVGVAALGTCGDLFESLLKRWAGVKDSGDLLPGHGGMLDRLDSLLFAAPLLHSYFLALA